MTVEEAFDAFLTVLSRFEATLPRDTFGFGRKDATLFPAVCRFLIKLKDAERDLDTALAKELSDMETAERTIPFSHTDAAKRHALLEKRAPLRRFLSEDLSRFTVALESDADFDGEGKNCNVTRVCERVAILKQQLRHLPIEKGN